ncbi:MAG TPA: prephenate dehydratase [Planctomycetes bacterium]|nr:prephenate dehydratase [Planctomycetota bacterium]HIJ71906.1 prephenate dehydratase [Planctomycetota bacterium]
MSLEELRKQIDKVDSRLIELLNERAQIVIEIGKLKSKNAGPIYAPDREKEVFDKIVKSNKGPLPDKTLTAIWRELMSGSFFLERPLRIAYLGPQGSFSHTAAMLKFGQSVEYEAVTDIRSIFDEVSKGHSDLGVVPIENSAGGGVGETLDAFVDSDVLICAEVFMSIHHNLLANCSLAEIEKVYSKPEVFAQCHGWLSLTFKEAKTVSVASSARAAQMAAEEKNTAAIGSKVAAELYGLKVVCENIEDIANNVTRFLVISKVDARPTGDDKTAILFSTAHKAGALVDVLDVFRKYGLNLTNIESRPGRKREWEYYFFVDFIGHKDDKNSQKALDAARGHCLQLSVLGSFPRCTSML